MRRDESFFLCGKCRASAGRDVRRACRSGCYGARGEPVRLSSGDITTVAGGYGGPGPATAVSLDQLAGCFGMQIARGRLYLNGGGVERAINVRTGTLRTVATQLVPASLPEWAG